VGIQTTVVVAPLDFNFADTDTSTFMCPAHHFCELQKKALY
jgi:hypothetical protein